MPDYRTKAKFEEGTKLKMYKCTNNKWTVGTGHNIQDRGISQAASDFILDEDLKQAERDAKRLVSDFNALPDNRKIALVDMSFQLGYNRLSKFKNMLQAVNDELYNIAAKEMLNSRWAKQTPNRANRNAKLMENG